MEVVLQLGVVYVTVKVPAVDRLKSIAPLVALIESPDGEEVKPPPVTPVTVGVGSVPSWQ